MDLKEIRTKIDAVDDGIVGLFRERMALAAQVAECKKSSGTAVLDRTREREIVARLTEGMDDELAEYVKVLYNTLFSLSRSSQARRLEPASDLGGRIQAALESTDKLFPSAAMVACQGAEGAYSQMACDKLFSRPSILYFASFRNVFEAVEKNLCRYGILPIENSIYGSVNEVYDLMKQHNFHIVRSIKLRVSHSLLAPAGVKLEDIREVVSHEQALGQCSEFIKSLGDVKVTVCENTAVAARTVAGSGRRDVAAISSENCAELYGLRVLRSGVQNSDHNYTRFICISKGLEIYPGANRISIMFNVPHTPGSLYNFMSRISALGLNILKLESRPIPGRDFEFMFYMDLDASVYSQNVISLLCELDSAPELFVFLGSYSEI